MGYKMCYLSFKFFNQTNFHINNYIIIIKLTF